MNDLSDYKMSELEKRVEKIESALHRVEMAEQQKLKWGISVLGGAFLGVVGVVWAYRGVIFRG